MVGPNGPVLLPNEIPDVCQGGDYEYEDSRRAVLDMSGTVQTLDVFGVLVQPVVVPIRDVVDPFPDVCDVGLKMTQDASDIAVSWFACHISSRNLY